MASSYKVLGQVAPTATTQTTLYTTPALTQSVCSTLVICNRGTTASFRVAVVPSGDTLSNENYIVYDNYVNQYDTIFLTLGLTLSAGDVVTVYASSGDLSFGLFGTEIA